MYKLMVEINLHRKVMSEWHCAVFNDTCAYVDRLL